VKAFGVGMFGGSLHGKLAAATGLPIVKFRTCQGKNESLPQPWTQSLMCYQNLPLCYKISTIKARAQQKMKKQRGFTIIEILIVIAIAGLVLAVIFLALPGLQRNSRNHQRKVDASKVMAAIQECMIINHFRHAACDQLPSTELPLNMSELTQITSVVNWTITQADMADLNAGKQIAVLNGHHCNSDNSWVEVNVNPKRFILFYIIETSTGWRYFCTNA
jgi:prepilin-type N-terminal cleavage/methylation domain-containing protein